MLVELLLCFVLCGVRTPLATDYCMFVWCCAFWVITAVGALEFFLYIIWTESCLSTENSVEFAELIKWPATLIDSSRFIHSVLIWGVLL
jgi:hypothetical protein